MICQKSVLLLNYIALNSVPQISNLRVKCKYDFNYLILGIIPTAERTKMNKINPFVLRRHWRGNVHFSICVSDQLSFTSSPAFSESCNSEGWFWVSGIYICELWVTSYQSCLWLYMTRPQDHIIIWSWERSYYYVVLRKIITFLWVSFWLLVKNMKTTRIIDDPWIGRDGFCLRPLALNFLISWCLF